MEELEWNRKRPQWLPATLAKRGLQWGLNAEGLYRDVFHTLWCLAVDEEQMERAEKRFDKGQYLHHR